jgi:hypothetical protein
MGRNLSPAVLAAVAREHDQLGLWTLEQLMQLESSATADDVLQGGDLALQLTPLQQMQAQLPLREGGFNLRSITQDAAAAYLAGNLTALPPFVTALSASDMAADRDFLQAVLSGRRVRELHATLRAFIGQVTEAKIREDTNEALPSEWLAWGLQPLGTIPTAATLMASRWPHHQGPIGVARSKPHFQRFLMRLVHACRAEELARVGQGLQQPTGGAQSPYAAERPEQFNARVRSLQGAGASAWMLAKPSLPHMRLTAEQTGIAACRRLGIYRKCPPGCPGRGCSAGNGDERHGESCMRTGGPQRVHTGLRDVTSRHLLGLANISHRVEDTSPFPSLIRQGGVQGRQRAMDLVLPGGALSNGGNRDLGGAKRLLLDITVANVLAPSHINHLTTSSANFSGAAADHAVASKTQQYQGSFDPASFSLQPLVAESGGRLGGSFPLFLSALAEHVVGGRRAARFQAGQKGPLLNYFRQVVSVALQRGLANSILTYRALIASRAPERARALLSLP